jgi:hypothetical protein
VTELYENWTAGELITLSRTVLRKLTSDLSPRMQGHYFGMFRRVMDLYDEAIKKEAHVVRIIDGMLCIPLRDGSSVDVHAVVDLLDYLAEKNDALECRSLNSANFWIDKDTARAGSYRKAAKRYEQLFQVFSSLRDDLDSKIAQCDQIGSNETPQDTGHTDPGKPATEHKKGR